MTTQKTFMKVGSAWLTGRSAECFITAVFLVIMMVITPATSKGRVSIGVAVSVAPPPLVVYEQPICPGPGFIWTPGYWAWGPDGYYWVPGTWVLAPYPGELWTPGYWAWNDIDDVYAWNAGYWGPEVGFYGGIAYGYGYFGSGYDGGYWRDGNFFYNRAVNNVNTTNITNIYNRTVVNNVTPRGVSFNGGAGGTTARPTATEIVAGRLRHDPPAAIQRHQEQMARNNRRQLASRNHGQPPIAATPKPGAFNSPGAVSPKSEERNNIALNRAHMNRAASRTGKHEGARTRPLNTTRPNAASPRNVARPAMESPARKGVPRHQSNLAAPQRPIRQQQRNVPHAASQRARQQRQAAPHKTTQRRVKPSRGTSPHAVAQHRSAPLGQRSKHAEAQRNVALRTQKPARSAVTRGTADSPKIATRSAAMHRTNAPPRSEPHSTAMRRTMTPLPNAQHAVTQQRSTHQTRSAPRGVSTQRSVPSFQGAPRAVSQHRGSPLPKKPSQGAVQRRRGSGGGH
jgi:WXXGXW repeat (2 copies)